MHAWEAIQKAVDYIEEHLKDEIDTETLAELAGLSPFYFQRLFKRLVKKPVKEYIKLRRLARVTKALDQGEQRILDAALEYGFSGHGNFTRAFKEAYGITPDEYRKNGVPLNLFLKPEICLNYTMIDEGVPLIVGDIVIEIRREVLREPERYLGLTAEVAVKAQIPMGESTGVDVPGQLWSRYHREKAAIADYLDPEVELGMSCLSNPETGTFTYFAGGLTVMRTSAENRLSRPCGGFVSQELPAGEYIVCGIEAEQFHSLVTVALDQAGKYLFGTWLPGHKLTTQPFSAEKYERNREGSCYMELWVMLISHRSR